MSQFISVEGNIGAGKSSIVDILLNRLNVNKSTVLLQEPVKQWTDLKESNGQNILELFYQNPDRWSYSFQMNAFITRLKLIEEAIKKNPESLIITERTVQTDRNCFAKELYSTSNISELEWKLYNEWYHWLIDKTKLNPSAIIYLKVSPKICEERIKKRDRKEELSVPIEYLEKIHKRHEDWLNERTDIPILTIDFSGNISDEDFMESTIEKINNFIKSIIKSD